MDLKDFLDANQLLFRLVISIGLAGVILIARGATTRMIRGRADVLDTQRRRQLFYARSAFNTALALGLLLIWLGQVHNLVLSLTAVTVALVVATKELLMCVTGFFLRTGASSYSVGDWIEVNGLRGEVTDYNLLSTTILEITPPRLGHAYTGNRLVLPNSLFLSHPVRNEQHLRHHLLHRFTVTVDPPERVDATLAWLEAAAHQAWQPFAEKAREHSRALDQRLGVDLPGPAPVVSVATNDNAKLAFSVLLFCPAAKAQDLEREITCALLDRLRADEPPTATA